MIENGRSCQSRERSDTRWTIERSWLRNLQRGRALGAVADDLDSSKLELFRSCDGVRAAIARARLKPAPKRVRRRVSSHLSESWSDARSPDLEQSKECSRISNLFLSNKGRL